MSNQQNGFQWFSLKTGIYIFALFSAIQYGLKLKALFLEAENPNRLGISPPVELVDLCNEIKNEAANPEHKMVLSIQNISHVLRDKYPNIFVQGYSNNLYFQYNNQLACLVTVNEENQPTRARMVYFLD